MLFKRLHESFKRLKRVYILPLYSFKETNPLIRFLKNLFKTNFCDVLTKLGVSRCFQPTTYSVFHEESEYEVKNIQIHQEILTNSISYIQKLIFQPDQRVTPFSKSCCYRFHGSNLNGSHSDNITRYKSN